MSLTTMSLTTMSCAASKSKSTPSEAVAIGGALEQYERERAAERMTAGTNQHTEPCGKLPQGSTGKTRDKVAAAVGMSGKTYEKAKAVVAAAEQDPEAFGDLPKLMAYSITKPMARASNVVSSRPGAALANMQKVGVGVNKKSCGAQAARCRLPRATVARGSEYL